jgi:hypothetical protein
MRECDRKASDRLRKFWLNLQREVDLYLARRKIGSLLDQLTVLRQPKPPHELLSKAKAKLDSTFSK